MQSLSYLTQTGKVSHLSGEWQGLFENIFWQKIHARLCLSVCHGQNAPPGSGPQINFFRLAAKIRRFKSMNVFLTGGTGFIGSLPRKQSLFFGRNIKGERFSVRLSCFEI
jgi:hypothetical protein